MNWSKGWQASSCLLLRRPGFILQRDQCPEVLPIGRNCARHDSIEGALIFRIASKESIHQGAVVLVDLHGVGDVWSLILQHQIDVVLIRERCESSDLVGFAISRKIKR